MGWPDDTVLLVMLHAGTERYLPAIRQNLDLFWPGRPDTVFATDGAERGDDVIVSPVKAFLPMLDHAVGDALRRKPEATHVFVLLEDLCPMAPVDEEAVAKAQTLARAADLAQVSMNWAHRDVGRQRYADWRENGVVEEDGITMVRMPQDCPFFNCLVGSVWQTDHLQAVIAAKLAEGRTDPWSFERPLADQSQGHYMFEGIWPTEKDGFLCRGKVNSRLVTDSRYPRSPLMRHLRQTYCGSANRQVAWLRRRADVLNASLHKRGLLN